MSDTEESQFINIKAAARMLGVSPLTLRNWDKRKKLVAFRHPINNYRVYKLADIHKFIGTIENTNKPKKLKIEFLDDNEEESSSDELVI